MPRGETTTENAFVDEQRFSVNDGELEPDQITHLRPTSLKTPIEKVHRRYREEEYVFLKGLLLREAVLEARRAYFELLSPCGVLAPGSEPVEGILDSSKDKLDFPGIGAGSQIENGRPTGAYHEIASKFIDLALQAHSEDLYKETFCKHPALYDFVSRMAGWHSDTLGICRTLLRNNTPGNMAIGVHYDQIFLRHGEDTLVTPCVPMGDIAFDGGGLIYLENGHTLGNDLERDFTRKATSSGMTDQEAKNAFNKNMMSGSLLADGPAEFGRQVGRRWQLIEYEAGDVMLHTTYTSPDGVRQCWLNPVLDPCVDHQPRQAEQENKIRVGTDLRFVDSSRPWDKICVEFRVCELERLLMGIKR